MSERKIALVGTAPSIQHAPFGDPSYEIWGVGAFSEIVTRADRWFEVHRLSGQPEEWQKNWRAQMKNIPCPVWMMYPDEWEGETVRYPIEEITEQFGTFFMTSTFSWMMALAIHEKADKIGLWGVDFEYGNEYEFQRTGLQHFKHLAKYVGISIEQVLTSGLTYDPVPYPFWQDDPLIAKIHLRRQVLTKEKDAKRASITSTHRRLSQIQALLDEGSPPDEERRRLKAERQILEATLPDLTGTERWCQGALEEIGWLEDYLRP